MALNCGGRPPDPAPAPTQILPGYLPVKKSSEMVNMPEEAVAIESSHQVASTPMFGSESCTTSFHNMTTGSSLSSSTNRLSSIQSEEDTNHKGVSLITSRKAGYNEGGLGSNNTIIDAATNTIANQYYQHPDQMVQMGSHHNSLCPAMPHEQQIIAAAEYSHPTCEIGQLGNTSLHIQLQPGATDHHPHPELRLPQLQLQCQSAALSQLQVASNHLCSTEALTRSELLQPVAGADHLGVPCYDMSLKIPVQQQQDVDSRALEAAVRHTQGKADQHLIERGRHAVTRAVQTQHVNMSPEGSSMVSMEEQEGVHYNNGGSCSAGGITQMNVWDQYNMQVQEGQSLMRMKKRRLTNEQVKSLEGSFETESKLEAERKKELAQELGLQPRQVAVWFQNRRARFKAKQLERDFDLLKHQYDAVRSEKDKLLAEVNTGPQEVLDKFPHCGLRQHH